MVEPGGAVEVVDGLTVAVEVVMVWPVVEVVDVEVVEVMGALVGEAVS